VTAELPCIMGLLPLLREVFTGSPLLVIEVEDTEDSKPKDGRR